MSSTIPDSEWRPWLAPRGSAGGSPYDYAEVETMREDGRDGRHRVDPLKMPPDLNIAGLFWRPVDAREHPAWSALREVRGAYDP